jgi:diadenosine tetraphosphate (Ap4A) HIT family hydrolase
MPLSPAEAYEQIVSATRPALQDGCPECLRATTDGIVWEDEYWILTRAEHGESVAAALLLQTREHSRVGQLDDELASQFGRISNRLVRIIESTPQAEYVDVSRYGADRGHFHVWYFAPAAGGGPADLHLIATKLANWGGDARA